MNAVWKLIVAVIITTGFLAGCGDDGKYQGKTAQEWAAESERIKAASPPPSSKSNQEVQGAEAEKKQALRQEEAKKKYLAMADEQMTALESSKDGELLIRSATTALEGSGVMGVKSDEETVLGSADMFFFDRVISAIVPDSMGTTVGEALGYDIVQSGQGKVRGAIIAWVVKDQKRLDVVWSALRPVLRQQYALLKSLRGYEPLFKTVYTRKGFEPLTECLTWHESIVNSMSDSKIDPTAQDINRCDAAFKKFGVKTSFGDEKSESSSARNALWIVRFFARREADGGEKFAQKFQKLALDYIKS